MIYKVTLRIPQKLVLWIKDLFQLHFVSRLWYVEIVSALCKKSNIWSNILSRNGKRKYLDFPKDESINLDSNRYSWCRPPLKRTKKMARDWKYFLLSLIGGLGTLLKNDARKVKRARLRIYRQFTNRSYAYNLFQYYSNMLNIHALLTGGPSYFVQLYFQQMIWLNAVDTKSNVRMVNIWLI